MNLRLKRLFGRVREIPTGTPTSEPGPRYGERLQFRREGQLEEWIKSRYKFWPAADMLFCDLMEELPEGWLIDPADETLT